jgi:general stress protein 26
MLKSVQDIRKMIEQQPVCDLITVDGSGVPAERAMFTPIVDDRFTVYLGTFAGSNKCGQIKTHSGVVAVWPVGTGYVSLRGKAEILDDQPAKDHAWHPEFAPHFAGGSSDPNFLVIKISPVSLTYYEEGMREAETITL